MPKQELFTTISALIDKGIHANYRIYPNNYVALDLLNGTTEYAANYTDEDKQTFLGYLDQQIARIQLPNKDVDFLRTKLLEMYANPLKNYLNAQA